MQTNKKPYIIAYTIIIVLFLLIGFSGNQSSEERKKNTDDYFAKHIIKKDTFQGRYPFTVDKVQIHNVVYNEKLNLTGVMVIINGEKYALTSNLSAALEKGKAYDPTLPNFYIPFLPSKYLLSGDKKGNMCVEVLTEFNSCKASLADVVEYANSLQPEKL